MVKKVTVWQTRSGAWSWSTTDPGGRIKIEPAASGYSRKSSAIRGAKRKHAPTPIQLVVLR